MGLRALTPVVRFLVLTSVLAAPTWASAQRAAEPRAGVITGLVTDSTGGVLVGASVSLRDPGGRLSRETSTDARGRYRFDNLRPGAYLVTAFRDGFGAVTEEIVLGAEAADLDLSLTPATFSEEVTVAFTGEHAHTALKMPIPVRDVPFTVKSYTGAFIKALDTKQVADLYTYMTGVNRSGDSAYNFTVRGFSAGEPNNLETNGMPGLPARQSSPNIANIERIEVLKGPASILYGRAQPGGLVNLITKRPLAERQHLLDFRSGTFFGNGPGPGDSNSYRFSTDLTGPIGDSSRFLYRFVMAYDNDQGFRDFVENEDLLIVPSFTWNVSAGSILTVEAEYRRLDNSLDQGLVAPHNDINFVAAPTIRYQEPGDREKEDGYAFNVFFTRLFANGASWNTTWRSVTHKDERKGLENNRAEADNRRVRRRDRHQINHRDYHYIDTNVTYSTSTGAIGHDFLLGFNGGYEMSDFNRLRFGNLGLFVDLRNPVYGQPLPANPNPGFHNVSKYYDTGLYIQDRLTLTDQWKLLGGLRYDRQSGSTVDLRGTLDAENTVSAVVPMGGVVFQPGDQWSLYTSFSRSFDPPSPAAVNAEGVNDFEPQVGNQLEGGVKLDLANGRADATLAVYRITRENVIIPTGTGFNEAIGKERSRGFEFDVRMRPVLNWQTIVGYAYTDAAVVEDTRDDRLGARTLNSAKHAFNVWSRYDLLTGPARGLGFGLGLIYRSHRAGSFPSDVVRGDPIPGEPIAAAVLVLPAYLRTDLGMYYVRQRYELTLRVNNLLDEQYFESAFNLIQIRPGNPRQATLSMRVRF